jgi:3-deoxy-D-manno-octulosonic-acid transferase
MDEAVRSARAMLARHSTQQAAADASLKFAAQHRGAAANTVQALARFLEG